MTFPFYKQPDTMDCGPTCIRIIAKYYGRSISLEKLRSLSETTREGSSLKTLSDAAEKIGFRTLGVKINLSQLIEEANLPCILHWNQRHFVVLYKINHKYAWIADPGHGRIKLTHKELLQNWSFSTKPDENLGIVLLMDPTPKLKEVENDDKQDRKSFSFLFQYLFVHKKLLIQLGLGLFAGSLLQLIFPFLTQSVVDIGIQNKDIHFVYLVLMAQLFLFLGKMSVQVLRSWIMLHVSTRINISLISDFFIKLMNLPISYFDVKMTGDLMQRIGDHNRIESLLTSTSLNVLFSLFNLIVFGAILAFYDLSIFSIFFVGSLFYLLWVVVFLKKRKELDYKMFSQSSQEQSKVIELINGMQEIKLHNAEKEKRWGWERIQAKLFKIEVKNLALEQTQSVGSEFINELKNILITIFSAKLVIDGEITLGMMMAISYIIGQLNGPIMQLIGFIYSVQDAKIALERLGEIHDKEDEEVDYENKINTLPFSKNLHLNNVSFRYKGTSENVLNNLNLEIEENKVTAIVGTSGSGKTTLLKLLMKFYEPTEGEITLGSANLKNIKQELWRGKCGTVMQEGYIFNDTILNNIVVSDDASGKKEMVNKALEIANIRTFVEELPLMHNTKIGLEGAGISTGQKQRLLIARAIYKNPKYLFFDEATSALDAENEKVITSNLEKFLADKTAVVIAHRLSTVKNADKIVVLDKGMIVEEGTHTSLVKNRGAYYQLVKNQLELGS